MTKLMGRENINILMVANMKEHGKKINSMVLVKKSGQMELCIKENMWMEESKEKEYLLGQMDQLTVGNFQEIILKEEAFIVGVGSFLIFCTFRTFRTFC